MKGAILAVVIAAGVGGPFSSSDAQEVKKLPPHPAAAADPSLRQANPPTPQASYPGGAYVGGSGAGYAKPVTGEAVVSGATSTNVSKQSVRRLPPHPAAAADPSLRQAPTPQASSSEGAYVGGTAAGYSKPVTGEAVVSGETSTNESKQK
jgi:hypothetical protein